MGQPKLNFISDESLKNIRDKKVAEGLQDLKSTLANLEIDVKVDRPQIEAKKHEPRYTDNSLSEMARRLYRENVKPVIDEPNADEVRVPSTYAQRVNTKALAKALISMRNPDNGDEGKFSPPASTHGGNKTNNVDNYYALTTSMSLEEYQDYISKKFVAEEPEVEETVEAEPQLLNEKEPAVSELEDELVEMSDTSWQSIDKVMRKIATEHDITPKELHKAFKSEHGMIPDAWAEQNSMMEESGWMPLDEAVALNKVGNVYEVTFMFRAVTKRVKFFWPQVSMPTRDEMQEVVKMLYPGAVLLSFYLSTHDGDNKDNHMVVVAPSTPRTVVMRKEDWAPMSDAESLAYELVCEEHGEPVSPPMVTDAGIELWIEDHDTGEERAVIINEDGLEPQGRTRARFKLLSLGEAQKGLWDNIHAKRKRGEAPAKKGDKDYPKTLNVEDYETTKKKEVLSALNKKKGDFTKRYGKDGPDVMHAVAAKTAKDKGDTSKSDDKYAYESYSQKKKYNAPKVPGNLQDKDREQYLKDLSPERPGKINEDDMKGMSQKSGDKRSTESGAGLTAKGVAKYRRNNPGSKLKTAVTTPPSKLKAGSKAAGRRKSFCARSRGWNGERGKAARARWNC